MGTNYYVEGKHVGKVSSMGRGNGHRFIWAMRPGEFVKIVADHVHPLASVCKGCKAHVGPLNDYCGDCMGGGTCRHADDNCETCQAALAVLEASAEEFDSIGTEFS